MTKFAKRMSYVSGDVINEILKLMADPEIISFGGGSPAKEAFPSEIVTEIMNQAMSENPIAMLQYGVTQGYMPLREAYLAHLVKPKGVNANIENTMTLTGATQGIGLVSDVFLSPGDKVLVESPTFLSTLFVFNKLECQCIPVEVDDNGMIMEDLEEKMKLHRPKMLYSVPTFQNPTGRTIPAGRRQKIAELASKYDVIVLEDDPYCELRYHGESLPPIKSFDETGHVIMLNSFSKIISPGIRVGAMTASPDIIEKVTTAKQLADTHTPYLTQFICAEFLNRGLLPGHLKAILPIYAKRLSAMLTAIEETFPKGAQYTEPDGGLFIWVKLPGRPDIQALLQKATSELKVAFIPGGPFFIDPKDGDSCIRLNFSSNSPENISLGIRKLGNLFTEELGC